MGIDWGSVAEGGGRGLSAGVVVYTAYRLFMFVCSFLAGRYDARQKRLDDQQARLDERYDARLEHLERAEIKSQSRIHLLETAVEVLTTELYTRDPGNPKIREVAAMLARAIAVSGDTPGDMTDSLGKMP